ncbi:MAG: ABC transporter permease [Oscillospiraceae bacterium]|nr:ABC transporter permease [Oscillospiraceae bacterium]
MRKFVNIIVNEYIKILLKLSTIIMLITVVLIAVGYNVISFAQDKEQQRWMTYSGYTQSYTDEIQQEKSRAEEGWEERVAALEYLRDNDIDKDYYSDDFWMSTAVYSMFSQKTQVKQLTESGETARAASAQRFADELETAVKNKDWKAYNKTNAAMLEADLAALKASKEYDSLTTEQKGHHEIDLWAAKYKADNDIQPAISNWKNYLVDQTMGYKYQLSSQKALPLAEQRQRDTAANIALMEESILIGEYRLENDIKSHTTKSSGVMSDSPYGEPLGFWSVFTTSAFGINFISVLIIIVAGSVISSEFSTGTIKYLLVNPVKRYKIFLAKYFSVLSFAFLMILVYYVINMILSGILFGFGDFAAPYLYVSGGRVIEGSSFLFVAGKYLFASVGMICMATLALAISSVARSSALSIGLGTFLYLSGYGIVAVMSQLRLDFGRYIIFSNLELNAIAEGASMYKGQTLTFALVIIGIYMAVFLLTAWDGFVRRDVK